MTTARFIDAVSFWRTADTLVEYEAGAEVSGEEAVFVLGIPTLPVVEIDDSGTIIGGPFASVVADRELVAGDDAAAEEG